MLTKIRISCFIIIIIVLPTASWGAEDLEEQPKLVRKLPLEQYLLKMGIKLDCYFTLEKNQGGTQLSPLDQAYLVEDEPINTIDKLIEQLQQKIPKIAVVRNKDNPVVIHLIEDSLRSFAVYPLDQKANVTHIGSLGQLPDTLSQSLNGSITSRRWTVSTQAYGDYITKLHFAVEAQYIRNVLTNYVPLSRYHRILWNAQTLEWKGKQETWIQYFGLSREKYLNMVAGWEQLRSPLPFSHGEIAYVINSASEYDVAIQFIENNESHQVRWAMFWLGRHKVEEGIPNLLKYLNYEYTPVPLLDERFPAFRALKEIGPPAATAALNSLPNETDARRLELLARIVLHVRGETAGRKALANTLATVKDAARQERLKTAFKAAEEPTATATVAYPQERNAASLTPAK